MFESSGMEQATETTTEGVKQANPEQTTEAMEQANLEQAAEAVEQENLEQMIEPAESADMESMMDVLGLTPAEREAFEAIDSELMNAPLENAYGNAKVYGDCTYTTCSYTTTSYSCTWTKP